MTSSAERAREYYRALDEHDYDALADLLDPAFVQHRPDLTLRGRERFVRFMREERPQTDTTHAVEAVYVQSDSSAGRTEASPTDDDHGTIQVAARGRLLGADGDLLTRFVDVFTLGDDGFERLETFTR